jgi:hypothetical protein
MRYLCALLIVLQAGASAALAQSGAPTNQCTGPHTGDAGDCRALPGGGGGTVSIVIEREVVWVPGPPIIIWKHPSAEGSRQSDFVAVDDPAIRRAIDDWSQTSWSLYQKGKAEMKRGRYAAAEAYFNGAMGKHPPGNEIGDIRSALAAARARAGADAGDSTTIRKFSKTEIREITPTDLPPQLFDARRIDLDPLRKEIAPLLMKRYQAEDALKRLERPGPTPNPDDVVRAKAALDKAKAAVAKKIEANKPLITRTVVE